VTRRLEFELARIEKRIHLLEGFEIIFDALDEALELIRSSEGKSDAREKLMERFELDHDQSEAILETKLYRLAKLEIESIREELEEKRAEAAELRELLDSEIRRWTLIRNEIKDLRDAYGDERKTRVDKEVRDFDYSEEDYIVDEEAIVIVTRNSTIKRQKSYTSLDKIRIRDNDELGWVMPGSTRDTVLMFTSAGRAYTMRIDDVPATSGYGDPLQSIFDFADGERVIGCVTLDERVMGEYRAENLPPAARRRLEEEDEEAPQFVAITAQGQSVRFSSDGFEEPSTSRGRMFMRVEGDDHVVNVEPIRGDEIVVIATHEGRGLTFYADDFSYYKGPAKGVRAIDLDDGDEILDWTLSRDEYSGLPVETNNGTEYEVRASLKKFAPTSRGNKGRWVIKRGHLIRSKRGPVEVPAEQGDEEE
jgi:DNA gyrase subunit A